MRRMRYSTSANTKKSQPSSLSRTVIVSSATLLSGSVLSDSLTATGAHDVAKGIRGYFDGPQVEDINIAFREKFKFLAGPAFYRLVEEGDALQPVIDDVLCPSRVS